MQTASRRLAISKRVSLANIAEGWDDCYALVAPCSYQEYAEIVALIEEGKTKAEIMAFQLQFVKSHLISGKVRVFDESNQPVLVDITPEDIELSQDISDTLCVGITGVAPDPKDTSPRTETSPTLTPTSEPQPNTNTMKTS